MTNLHICDIIITERGKETPQKTREVQAMLHYEMKYLFKVNNVIVAISADGKARAEIEADRRFGKSQAEFIGIKIQ